MAINMRSFSGVAVALAVAAAAVGNVDTKERAAMRLAAESLEGPVRAAVERVIDGDTIEVRARIWLGQTVGVLVRIEGIDAPELNGRCESERRQAVAAREYLRSRVMGTEISLSHITYDKYGGRVLAQVTDREGNLSEALVAAGLARAYSGLARQPWCTPA